MRDRHQTVRTSECARIAHCDLHMSIASAAPIDDAITIRIGVLQSVV